MTLFSPEHAVEPAGLATELSQTMPVDEAGEILLLDTPRAPKPLVALGCAWHLTAPVNVEVMDEDRLESLAMQHAGLVHGLPPDSVVQTLMLVLPSTQAKRWEQRRAGITDVPLLDIQRQHIGTGLPHSAGPMHARMRTFHTLVTLRCPLPDTMADALTLIKAVLSLPAQSVRTCKAFLQKQLADALPTFLGCQRSIENTLHGCGHGTQRLTSVTLGEHMARILNPLGKQPTILPDGSLRDQIVSQYTQRIDGGWAYGTWHHDTGTFTEDVRNQVVSLQKLPLQTYPGMCSSTRMPRESTTPEPMALWNTWDGPMLLVMNAFAVDQAKEDASLEMKGRVARWQRKFSVRNKKIAKAIRKVMANRLVSQMEMGAFRMHLVLWGHERELKHGMEEAQRTAGNFKLTFLPEPGLGSTLFLQCLPLGCNKTYPPEWALRRQRKAELPNVLDLLLVFGAFLGTETATHFALNQRGEEVGYDLFDTTTNAHRATIGTSGAGKTYLTAKEIMELLAVGGKVVLLDPLSNYRAVAAFWNGTYVRLNYEAPPRINPFYGPMDLAHRPFIAANLNEMAGNTTERLTWTGFNVLSDALGYFAEAWPGGEATISDFVQQVLIPGTFTTDPDSQAMGREIARRLSLYYGRGIYARFFDGPNTFRFGDQLTVIEFKELEKAQKLQAVLFFGLMNLLRLKTKSPEWRGARKHIKADELWAFLDYEETAEVFENMILTGRNDDLSIDFMTQLASHLDTPVGKVIRGIVHMVMFLQQDSSEFPAIAKAFNLTRDEQALFAKVQKHAMWNSGYLRMSHRPGGIIRIFGDPVTHLLMTQEPSIRAERERLLDAHPGDEHQAIHAWLRQKGVMPHA